MSDNSAIEWTDATWNPVVGCSRVSAGCDHCYAVGMTRRLEGMSKAGGFGLTGTRKEAYRGLTIELPQAAIDKGCGVNGRHFNGEVRCVDAALPVPLGWKKPKRIFVNSMSDLFHPKVPFEFIDKVFAVMNATDWQLPIPKDLRKAKPLHTYQLLTKRPERMAEYLLSRSPSNYGQGEHPLFKVRAEVFRGHGGDLMNAAACLQWPLPNVWIGTSCEDQDAADERIPHLLRCPAAVRFLSCEPLLGSIDLCSDRRDWIRPLRSMFIDRPAIQPGVDWVIVGGESGPGARPCEVDWIRSIVRQCSEAAVACFVKQLGAVSCWVGSDGEASSMHLSDRKGGDPTEWPQELCVRQFPKVGGAA